MPLPNAQPQVPVPSDGTVLLGIPPRPLTSGHRLRDYELKDVLARGTCSVVYLAWDHALQREVQIQEYLPAELGRRGAGDHALAAAVPRLQEALDAGRAGFLAEARQLARFEHASLAKVYRFFEDGGTAYKVMPLYQGPTLRAALASLGHVPAEAELRAWLRPVLDALGVLHDAGSWHGNVDPDHIVLTPTGPVLMGLGGAERGIARASGAPSEALSPGYAALEQYTDPDGTGWGPWTDFYALAAVVRAAITSEDLPPAPARTREDPLRPLGLIAAGLYSPGFLAAIDAALAVQPGDRPRDHIAWRAVMGDIAAPERMQLAPPRDLMQEPFDAARADDRIVTVPDRPLMAGSTPAEAVDGLPVDAAPTAPSAGTPSVARAADAAAVTPTAPAHRARTAGATRTEARGPSWLQGGGDGRRNLLYGVVAALFAAVGLGALAWQMMERGTGSATVSAPAPAATPPVAPPVAATPTTTTVSPPAAAPVLPPATPAIAASQPAAPVAASAPLTEADRQARCLDILQRASLESITPDDTAFFKRECR